MEEKRKEAYRIGIGVLVILGALTFGEFIIGLVASEWWGPLMFIASVKAFFVVRDYMHVGRLFAPKEEMH
jgi:hypothetical protein